MKTVNLKRLNSHFGGVTCHTEFITDYLKFALRVLLVLLLSMTLMGVVLAKGDDDKGDDGNVVVVGTFQFAVMGDTMYTETGIRNFRSMMTTQLNKERLEVIGHVGDINVTFPCDQEMLDRAKALFQLSENPLVYTPGDNEWTDCSGAQVEGLFGGPAVPPLDALELVRDTFYRSEGNRSLGRNTIELRRQSDKGDNPNTSFDESLYVENQLWSIGKIVFGTLHIPGAGDNCVQRDRDSEGEIITTGEIGDCSPERVNREAANLAWLDEIFKVTDKEEARGVVILLHSSMFRFGRDPAVNVYESYIAALEAKAKERPEVQIIQFFGDEHDFTVFHPFFKDVGDTFLFNGEPQTRLFVLDNYTAVQTYGFPDTGWVRITVDLNKRNIFAVEKGGLFNVPGGPDN